jgi:hypothetical protein
MNTATMTEKKAIESMKKEEEKEKKEVCCLECGVSTQGRKIRSLWNNVLCEKCGEEDEEEEEIAEEDCTRKKCFECGETKSCGLYNENHEWRCVDCNGEDDEE